MGERYHYYTRFAPAWEVTAWNPARLTRRRAESGVGSFYVSAPEQMPAREGSLVGLDPLGGEPRPTPRDLYTGYWIGVIVRWSTLLA